jgi:DNA-binding transcriptional regulator YhcF (GntR family)
MRELVVSTTDPTPPYEQLRRQLTDLIDSGSLAIGDRLPPLRQLAGDLGLAVGTVARTYRELESAGLIVSRRGGGTRVAGRPAQREHSLALRRAAEAYIREGKRLGARREDMIATLRAAFTVAD